LAGAESIPHHKLPKKSLLRLTRIVFLKRVVKPR
jgi:hypothetical protein